MHHSFVATHMCSRSSEGRRGLSSSSRGTYTSGSRADCGAAAVPHILHDPVAQTFLENLCFSLRRGATTSGSPAGCRRCPTGRAPARWTRTHTPSTAASMPPPQVRIARRRGSAEQRQCTRNQLTGAVAHPCSARQDPLVMLLRTAADTCGDTLRKPCVGHCRQRRAVHEPQLRAQLRQADGRDRGRPWPQIPHRLLC